MKMTILLIRFARNKILIMPLTSIHLGLLLALHFASFASAADLYVDSNANSGGDGSPAQPYFRITDAVAQARHLRQSAMIPVSERIIIHVAPGNYVGTYNDTKLAN